MSDTAILKEKLYIPIRLVNMEKVEQKFVKQVFSEKDCNNCEYLPERFCDVCETCPAYLGTFRLYNEKKIKDNLYVGLPIGNKKMIRNCLKVKDLEIKDKRPTPKFKHDIKFVRNLWGPQKGASKAIQNADSGLMRAPPRTGKTIISTHAAVKLGYKTLIMASQKEWLDQFLIAIRGDKENEAFTNVDDIERFEGRQIAGICHTVGDFDKYDICLSTYQKFITKGGKKKLEAVKDKFGTLIIDEAHKTAAKEYLKVIAAFNCKVKVGLTATDKRKDGLEVLTKIVLGKVFHSVEIETLVPKVSIIKTGLSNSSNFRNFVAAARFIQRDKNRNKLIIEHAVADIKAGHHVIIPVLYKDQIAVLVDGINKAFGKKVADGFHGSLKPDIRKDILQKARTGKLKCIVGVRQIVNTGVNVPLWSMLYYQMPQSNPPVFQQETSRVRTKMDGKKPPEIKFFIDNMGISKGCFRTCWWQGVVPLKFDYDKPTALLAKELTSNTRYVRDSEFKAVRTSGKL